MREREIGVGKAESASQNLRDTQYLQGPSSGKTESASIAQRRSCAARLPISVVWSPREERSPLQANALPGALSWAQESELLFGE